MRNSPRDTIETRSEGTDEMLHDAAETNERVHMRQSTNETGASQKERR